MLQQALFYQLRLFTLFNLDIRINALLLIGCFIVSFSFFKTYKVSRIICIISYLLLLIGTSNIFIYFSLNNNPLIDTRLSGYLFFWHAIFAFRSSAFVTFQVVFAFINLVLMIFFPFIFDKFRYFIYTLLIIFLITLITNLSGLSHRSIFLVDYLYYITGYFFGYLIAKRKTIYDFIDYLVNRYQ